MALAFHQFAAHGRVLQRVFLTLCLLTTASPAIFKCEASDCVKEPGGFCAANSLGIYSTKPAHFGSNSTLAAAALYNLGAGSGCPRPKEWASL